MVFQRSIETVVDTANWSLDATSMKKGVLAWVNKAIEGGRQDSKETVGDDPVVCVGDRDGAGFECFLASTLLGDEEDVSPVESAVGPAA